MATTLELEEYFKRICDTENWRNPIDAWIPEQEFMMAWDAVEFFTATDLVITDRNDAGLVRVQADGYRNGPAGP